MKTFDKKPHWRYQKQGFFLTTAEVGLDIIYRDYFGNDVITRRFPPEEKAYLDQHASVDALIGLPYGGVIAAVAEKTRDCDAYKQWHDITIEWQNGDGSRGEWWYTMTPYMLYCWEGETPGQLADWYLIDYVKLRRYAHAQGGLPNIAKSKQPQRNRAHGSSWFYSIDLDVFFDQRLILFSRASHELTKPEPDDVDNPYSIDDLVADN